jgi:hypothetical protein
MPGEGNDGKGATPKRAGTERPPRGWQALVGLWPIAIVGLIWFYNLDISSRTRTLILVGLILVIVLGAAIGLAWAKRYLTSVARVTTFVLLVLVVSAASLIPAVFLGPSGRIVVLKLGAILFLSLFPGLLYLQFISLRRQSLRDEFVTNLHRLQIDTYENLPRPPKGSIWFRPGDHRPPYEPDNVYQRKFDGAYGAPVEGHQVSLGGSWGEQPSTHTHLHGAPGRGMGSGDPTRGDRKRGIRRADSLRAPHPSHRGPAVRLRGCVSVHPGDADPPVLSG